MYCHTSRNSLAWTWDLVMSRLLRRQRFSVLGPHTFCYLRAPFCLQAKPSTLGTRGDDYAQARNIFDPPRLRTCGGSCFIQKYGRAAEKFRFASRIGHPYISAEMLVDPASRRRAPAFDSPRRMPRILLQPDGTHFVRLSGRGESNSVIIFPKDAYYRYTTARCKSR